MFHLARSTHQPSLWAVALVGLVTLCGHQLGLADEPITPPLPQQAVAPAEAMKAIEPLPPASIPDNPPPHEGALIDLPLVLEPPDIIVVEVLEALPGRPITGERLVRPDGTISLGFYGDVHVRGLNPEQAKVKILLHLRNFLADEVLGLIRFEIEGTKAGPLPSPGTKRPGTSAVAPDNRPFEKPDVVPSNNPPAIDPAKPGEATPSKPDTAKATRATRRSRRRSRRSAALVQSREPRVDPGAKAEELVVPKDEEVAGQFVYVEPAKSERVFVDIVAHKTKVYYVQGDVGTPGRLPFTGKETVLDAITYAGGLIPTAEPTDIILYRPGRGDIPSKNYKINYNAILKGDAKANLQMFPGDRLVVGRNPIITKSIELDRTSSAMNGMVTNVYQMVVAMRAAKGPNNQTLPGDLPPWLDRMWKDFYNDPGVLTNPQMFEASLPRWLGKSKKK